MGAKLFNKVCTPGSAPHPLIPKIKEKIIAVNIKKVSIIASGPIKSFEKEFSRLTVVYAKNEKGKTCIVENIIASIFKGRKDKTPILRKEFINDSTEIKISGLDHKLVTFSPNTAEKIDTYYQSEKKVMPKSLFKLLYVKGADTEIESYEGGINKTYIKSLFSKQKVYKIILDSIPREIYNTTIENGAIKEGDRRGTFYKIYIQGLQKLEGIKKVASEFYSKLSETEVLKIDKQIEKLKKDKQEQNKAKRHLAFKTAQKLNDVKNELAKISDTDIEQLDRSIHEYSITKKRLLEKESEIKLYKDPVNDENWLDEAYKIYFQYSNTQKTSSRMPFVIAAFISFSIAFLSLFFKTPIIPWVFLAISVLSLFLFIYKNKEKTQVSEKTITEIKKDFKRQFGKELNSIANFEPLKKELYRQKTDKDRVKSEIDGFSNDLTKLSIIINRAFLSIGYKDVTQNNWENLLNELRVKLKKNREQKAILDERVRSLDIDINDYIKDPGKVEYSRERVRMIEEKIKELDGIRENEKIKFNNIRKDLSDFIGSSAQESLEEINNKINDYISNCESDIAGSVSDIFAGSIMNEVLEELIKEEDKQLEAYLNDKLIIDLIKKITGKYDKLSIQGEDIIVWEQDNNYYLKNLSTGAQEQILLALRIGIAKKITNKENLFIILDDAFQYSDWHRRTKLIEQAVNIVKEGWQLIYFTMDDHIKEEFEKAAKGLSKNDFSLIKL